MKYSKYTTKTVLLISDCCGKGAIQAMNLVHALNNKGVVFELAKGNHRNCKEILLDFDIEPKSIRKTPRIYVDDLCFPAKNLNNQEFMDKLVQDLIKVN